MAASIGSRHDACQGGGLCYRGTLKTVSAWSGDRPGQDLECLGQERDAHLWARRMAWPHSPRSAVPAARQGYGRLWHLVEVSLDYRQRTPAAELWVWGLAPVPLQGCPDLGDR
jgi:hypothetical protein